MKSLIKKYYKLEFDSNEAYRGRDFNSDFIGLNFRSYRMEKVDIDDKWGDSHLRYKIQPINVRIIPFKVVK